jgi:hypothetical protein
LWSKNEEGSSCRSGLLPVYFHDRCCRLTVKNGFENPRRRWMPNIGSTPPCGKPHAASSPLPSSEQRCKQPAAMLTELTDAILRKNGHH